MYIYICKTSHTSIHCEDGLDQESASSHLRSIDFTLTRLWPHYQTWIPTWSTSEAQLSSAQDAMELIKCLYMYVPMYHLLKKTRTLLDALKQDGRHWVSWNYKGLCEDSAKQWSDTAMDTINGDGQIMSWPTTRLGLAEINWELVMGEKGMLMIMR